MLKILGMKLRSAGHQNAPQLRVHSWICRLFRRRGCRWHHFLVAAAVNFVAVAAIVVVAAADAIIADASDPAAATIFDAGKGT